MIHLYGAPGDFPATLCGLDRVWGNPYAAVYGKDVRLVNCPDCLARSVLHITRTAAPVRTREPDLVYIMCWVVVGVFVFIVLAWNLT